MRLDKQCWPYPTAQKFRYGCQKQETTSWTVTAHYKSGKLSCLYYLYAQYWL